MAEVTGTLGDQYLELNNAATEATLKAILAAMTGSAAEMRRVMDMAAKVGLDDKSIENANKAIKENESAVKILTKTELDYVDQVKQKNQSHIDKLNLAVAVLTDFQNGTTSASKLLEQFGSLIPGVLGNVIAITTRLVSIQEQNFETYQKLSASGINFSGNLTNLRLAASNAYLTLDQFSNILKSNSEALAKMGGTADEGAIAFSKAGAELVKGDTGSKLMALGYTAEDLNKGLADYISMTGGRNAKEMKQTGDLAKAAGEYLTELDDLAQITGKSREQQEEALKKASANEAYQAYLLTLDEEGKKKANIAMAEALAKGGEGAVQALQSQLLGLPPMTKAAQEFTAVAPKMAAANSQMADAVKDSSKGVSDIKKAGDALGVAASQTKKDLAQTGSALIMLNGSFSGTMGTIFGTANRNAQQGVETLEDAERQRASIEAKRQEREQSEADSMAKGMKALKELGSELWRVFSPLVSVAASLVKFMGYFASAFSLVLKGFNNFFEYFGTVGTVVKGVIVALGLFGAALAMARAKAIVSSKAEDIIGRFPVKGGGGGGGGGAPGPGKGGGGGGGGGPLGAIAGLGGGIGDVLKGLSSGLLSFANPVILLGAGIFAGSIALIITGIGAGVAAAAFLIGKALPTMAEGLKSFGEINGENLKQVAVGLLELGAGLGVFSAVMVGGAIASIGTKVLNIFSGGGPIAQIKDSITSLTPILPQIAAIGPALNNYASGIVAFGRAVDGVNIAKAKEIKELMKGPGLAESITSAAGSISLAATKLVSGSSSNEEKTQMALSALNNTMRELVVYMKDISENTKKNVSATKSLSGNLFA
jgi:Fe-S cluster assembly iron-binding protein IscA